MIINIYIYKSSLYRNMPYLNGGECPVGVSMSMNIFAKSIASFLVINII